MRVRLPSGARFTRDAWLLIAVSGVLSVTFYGIHNLLRVLYVLRLGHGPEYVGVFSASGALTYMAMGLPSGALGQRFGARKTMLVGGVIVVLGMLALPAAEYVPLTLRLTWPIATQVVLICGWSMVNVNIVPGLVAATAPESRGDVYAMNGAVRGLGTLAETYRGRVRTLNYKTLRYPGHCEKMQFLMQDLKLNRDRGTLKRILEAAVPRTHQDVVLVYVSVTGKQDGALFEENYVRKFYPREISGRPWAAIQVTTASALCAVADTVLQSGRPPRGFVTQESFGYPDFIANRFANAYA